MVSTKQPAKLNVTELDFNQIKVNLKDFLRSQDRFKDFDFEGSNFSVLLDLLAYNTAYLGFYGNMIANEMFLDTAILRESIVSRSKALGYVPFSKRSARATIEVEFLSIPNTVSEIIIEKGEKLLTVGNDGVTRFTFSVERGVSIKPNAQGKFIAQVPIIEGVRLEHRFLYDVTQEIPQRFIIPNADVDTTSINVKVQKSATNPIIENFFFSTDINTVKSDTPVFFLSEVEDQKYEIWFGDDVLGKAIEDGNIIIVDYVVSKGSEANGVRTFRPEAGLGGIETARIRQKVIESAYGGSEKQSDKSIKQIAPLYHETQNRAVTRNDYETLIKKDFPEIEFVRVWGGEDNVPPMYGKVFVSVKPFGTTQLSTSRKQQLINNIIRERNLISIEVDIAEPDFLNISINSRVRYNSRATNLSAGDIQKKIIQSIQQFRSSNLQGFNSTFRYSQLMRAIDDAENSILNNLTTISMRYRLKPPINFRERYVIQFNNPISRGDARNDLSAINTTGFLINNIPTFIADNGQGSLFYYRLVSNQRVILRNNIGTIDYNNGLMILNDFLAEGYVNNVDYIDIFAQPRVNDLIPQRNQIFLIDDSDINVLVDDDLSL